MKQEYASKISDIGNSEDLDLMQRGQVILDHFEYLSESMLLSFASKIKD